MNKLFLSLIVILVSDQLIAQVKKVDAIGITVKDMDRSLKFYTEVLGFTKISDREYAGEAFEKLEGLFGLHIRAAKLQLGDEYIELIDYLTSGGRSIAQDQQSNDLSFQHIAIVVSDMDRAFQWLKKFNVEYVSTSPQTLPLSNKAAAGIKAFYFHDPDGHNLELIYFPSGKGNSKWQIFNGKLFLGIDHTAIGVSNTDSSLKFYRDILGLELKGESWNFGTEQEHLNNVEGASLHISGLRTMNGPGIEFLQYLKPGPGRAYPADTRSDDLWNWQTILYADKVDELYSKLGKLGYKIISKELTSITTSSGTNFKAFVVRDPDGHAMLIMQEPL